MQGIWGQGPHLCPQCPVLAPEVQQGACPAHSLQDSAHRATCAESGLGLVGEWNGQEFGGLPLWRPRTPEPHAHKRLALLPHVAT